jgi:hypothetical protein
MGVAADLAKGLCFMGIELGVPSAFLVALKHCRELTMLAKLIEKIDFVGRGMVEQPEYLHVAYYLTEPL